MQPQDTSERFNISFDDTKGFDVVGLGMNAVDHLCIVPSYPRFDSKTEVLHWELQPGGPVATAIVCASRMGLKSKYVGKVGSDALGQLQLESLKSENVDISSVLVEQGVRNQYAFIIIERCSGERTILWGRDKRLNFRDDELRREDVCAGRVLHLDGQDDGAALRAATWARASGIPVVMDIDKVVPSTGALISKVDFLISSANFPGDLTGIADLRDALGALRKLCSGFVAVTCGANGAMAMIGDACVEFPAFPVKAVDTTGAGDIFHGAFVYGLLQNWPVAGIMRFANAAAGLGCTRLGARVGIPMLADALQLAGIDPVSGQSVISHPRDR